MPIVTQLLLWLQFIATSVSVEMFVVIGSFLEEIIAPIPSPFVMTTAAVIAKEQAYTLLQLGLVVVLGALAKTASTYVVYVAADKAEDIIIGKLGKFVGLDHTHIEKIGSVLQGTWWDDVLLFIARAVPLVPTFPISVAAGVIKYNVPNYLIITFAGSVIRNIFYLWVGYLGFTHLEKLWDMIREQPLLIAGAALMLLLGIVAAMKLKDFLYDATLEHHARKRTKKE